MMKSALPRIAVNPSSYDKVFYQLDHRHNLLSMLFQLNTMLHAKLFYYARDLILLMNSNFVVDLL